MEFDKKRIKVIESFNYVMNGISRTTNTPLKKTALLFSEKFESFVEHTAEFDQLVIKNDVLETKVNKLELLLSLFLPHWMHQTIDESDILQMKRLQLDNYYAVKSFINDSRLISEMNLYKKLGFRFKKGLTREQLELKIDDCRKKTMEKYANSTEQPKGINK